MDAPSLGPEDRLDNLAVRDGAIYDKDEFSIGCIATAIHLAAEVNAVFLFSDINPDRPVFEDEYAREREEAMRLFSGTTIEVQLRREFDMSPTELEKAMAMARVKRNQPKWLKGYISLAADIL